MLRETDPQTTMWDAAAARGGQAAARRAGRRSTPTWTTSASSRRGGRCSRPRLGRPSVPIETLLRLLYLKHRYGLGYETPLPARSATRSRGGGSAASGWTGRCRTRPRWSSWSRRAGPEVIEQLNTALVAKLAAGKLLRARKLRVDTTVVEADIDYPTDADLLEQAVRKLGGLVRRIKARGAASRTRFRDRGRAAGRRMKQLARTAAAAHRGGDGRGGPAHRRGRPASPGRRCGRCRRWRATPAGRCGRRAADGRLGRLVGELEETISHDRSAAGPDRPAPGRQPGDP